MSKELVRWMAVACLGASLAACGGDELPKPKAATPAGAAADAPKDTPKAVAKDAKAAAPVAVPTVAVIPGGVGVMIYPKVSDDFRKKLDQADFASDPVGDTNRDPFRSYLLGQFSASASASTRSQSEDVCKRRTIAADRNLRDLKLVGIVLRGTRGYALFTDNLGVGHTVNRGDCLSKERARIKAVAQDRVTLEIRAEATQGAPAPAPREEVMRLHHDDLDLSRTFMPAPSSQ